MKIGYLMQEGVPDIRKKPLSGAANHVVCVIQEFKRMGHQVEILAKFDKQIWWSDDLEVFKPVTVRLMDQGRIRLLERIIRKMQSEFKLAYANYFESLRFAHACQQELSDCEIYFERTGWLGYGGGLAAQWLGIPLILEVNGDHLDEFKSHGLKIQKSQHYLASFLMKKAASRVSHVVTTGEGWRQRFIERWKVAPSSVSVVENGSALVDILQRKELKSFKPIERGTSMQVAYCGGFEAWHGISILIRAVRRVIDHGCNLHITLVGSGSEKDKIIELIKELDMESYFTLTGHVNLQELAGYLAQSDVGVSPYCGRVEFSGLKLLDYKAAGLATIASGANNQPAVIAHQHTGWIVPPCDENALTQAIINFAENPELRAKIGQAARKEAETNHSWRHTAEQLLDIFNTTRKTYSKS